MKTIRFSTMIFSIIILLSNYALNCAAQKDDSESESDIDSLPDTAKAIIPSDEELEISLMEVGADIAEMILDKNALGLLKYVSKGERSVSYFPDVYKSYEEVKADLSDTTSDKFCQLFNTSCCCEDPNIKRSVYDLLLEGKSKGLNIKVKIFHDKIDDKKFVYAQLNYLWEGMPDEFYMEIQSGNNFVWTNEGWKFDTFFSLP